VIKKQLLFFVFLLFTLCFTYSQTIIINGLVKAKDEVENIHVINKTSLKFATTNSLGEFTISAKIKDTLIFSSIQYKLKAIKVTQEMFQQSKIIVELYENINQLDEVVVGKVLTKNLESDIENSKAKPKINFYDVGIPGYKGKPLTKRERELEEANSGKFIYYYGIGFAINIYKIMNTVSGRTKKLKHYVKLEKQDELMYKIKAEFSKDLFSEVTLKEHQKMEFFYFFSDDDKFEDVCTSYNNISKLEFLQEKLKVYLSKLKE
jgi:hypothetical protein